MISFDPRYVNLKEVYQQLIYLFEKRHLWDWLEHIHWEFCSILFCFPSRSQWIRTWCICAQILEQLDRLYRSISEILQHHGQGRSEWLEGLLDEDRKLCCLVVSFCFYSTTLWSRCWMFKKRLEKLIKSFHCVSIWIRFMQGICYARWRRTLNMWKATHSRGGRVKKSRIARPQQSLRINHP